MADRSKAELFGEIFTRLAEDPDRYGRDFILWVWRLTYRYDFHPVEIGCNEVLVKLGLARRYSSEDSGACEFLGVDYNEETVGG